MRTPKSRIGRINGMGEVTVTLREAKCAGTVTKRVIVLLSATQSEPNAADVQDMDTWISSAGNQTLRIVIVKV